MLRGPQGTLFGRNASWLFTGSQHHDAINTPQLFQNDYHLLHASVAVGTGDGRWTIVAATRNLTDERYLVTRNSAFATSAAYIELVFGRPRELSVAVEYSW